MLLCKSQIFFDVNEIANIHDFPSSYYAVKPMTISHFLNVIFFSWIFQRRPIENI